MIALPLVLAAYASGVLIGFLVARRYYRGRK